MVQIVDYTLIVPSLDVPVPQMANQLLEVCRQLDTPIPEQAIQVPKIFSSRHSRKRRVRFAEQTAEQLVEVPTIISYSSLHWFLEQNVDISCSSWSWSCRWWTSSAHPRDGSAGQVLHGCSWRCVDAVPWWWVETSGLGTRSLVAWVMAGTGPLSCASPRMLLEAFPVLCARAVRTWNLVHYFRFPVSGSHCSGRLGVAYDCENWIFREMTFFSPWQYLA